MFGFGKEMVVEMSGVKISEMVEVHLPRAVGLFYRQQSCIFSVLLSRHSSSHN
jgi:hypothetical protein